MTKNIPLDNSNIIEFNARKIDILYKKNKKKSAKEALAYLDSRQNILIKHKKIVQALLNNSITSLEAIKNITSREVKSFLLDKNNFHDVSSFLPKAPNTIDVKTTQLPISQIPEPSQEHLQKISKSFWYKTLYYKWEQLLNNQFKIEPDDTKCPDLSLDQAKDLYYKMHEISILHRPLEENLKSQYISNLTKQELCDHYQSEIAEISLELGYIQNAIQTLKEKLAKLDKKAESSKLFSTPNIFPRVVEGKTKDTNLLDLYKTKQNDIKDLLIILQSVAPHIYNKLADYRKEELEEYILENSQEIITYIDGAKLTVLEDRAFCALRYLAVKAFEQGLVVSPSVEITCKPSDIYKLSGVPYTNGKGYHTEQRLVIKNTLTDKEGNLIKRIHIEYKQKHKDGKAILSTNFVKKIHWNDEKDQVIFQVDSMFFVNIPGQTNKDYWLDDIIGRVGYISALEQGFKNERQYKLHKYLASCLRIKIAFNVTTLLEQSGLINDYKLGKKKSALTKLQSYLDGMYEYGTLIKNKPIKIPSKSDPNGKYELERI